MCIKLNIAGIVDCLPNNYFSLPFSDRTTYFVYIATFFHMVLFRCSGSYSSAIGCHKSFFAMLMIGLGIVSALLATEIWREVFVKLWEDFISHRKRQTIRKDSLSNSGCFQRTGSWAAIAILSLWMELVWEPMLICQRW